MKELDSDFNYLWSESINAVFFFFFGFPSQGMQGEGIPSQGLVQPFYCLSAQTLKEYARN